MKPPSRGDTGREYGGGQFFSGTVHFSSFALMLSTGVLLLSLKTLNLHVFGNTEIGHMLSERMGRKTQ